MNKLGLIAGNGIFPIEVADAARRRGMRVIAVAHQSETQAALESHVDEITWIKVGELQRMIDSFLTSAVDQVAFAGGISRERLRDSFAPDARALKMLSGLARMSDDAVLRGVAREIEAEKLPVIDPVVLLDGCLAQSGLEAGPQPTAAQLRDLDLAFAVARQLGSYDIGQTVAVRDGVVAAVEAVEGTDAAIRRAAQLCGKRLVIAKTGKPGQDLRFDRPAIGPESIQMLAEVGAAVLGVEAGITLILERKRTIASAAQSNVTVYGHA